MSLSASQLDAFLEVVKTGSFSQAAKNTFITQSALSQRIMNLENELNTALLSRETRGIRLTAAGEELLRYCKTRTVLENECLHKIKNAHSTSLAGIVHVSGYSTVMRSLVLKTLQTILIKNRERRLEMFTKEMSELPGLLRSGETDFIFLDHALEKEGLESKLIGSEEYVLVESSQPRKSSATNSVFLDHDIDDHTTHRFFEIQKKRPEKLTRLFLDEIYGIIDGVAMGLGKAVVPLHLIKEDKRIRVVPGYKPLFVPIYLHFYRQPFYTKLHLAVVELISRAELRKK